MTTDLATLSTKRVSYQTATFLRFISEPSEVRCFFVKTKQSGFSPGMHGYYGSSRFKQLVEHIQPYDGNAIGIYYGLNPAFENCLSRSEHTLRPASATFSCKTADIVRRRLLLVDIDPEREPNSSATDDEKYGAYQLGRRIYRYLKNAGWPQPIVLDSGNGYHLLYRIDLPVDDGGLVRECLKTLATTFNCGNIKIDTSVHDATRIAKLPGTMVCKGESSEERPHRRSGFFKLPHRFDVVPRELLDKLAGSREPSRLKKTLKPLQPLTASPPEVISRARAYLAKRPPSISGQNGRNHFLNAACRLVDDFALPREQAEPLLEEYNIRCVPPFNERELADKLDSALAKVVARGGPSGSKSGSAIADPPRSGPRFVGSVPDFAFVAIDYVLGRCDKPIPLGEMIYRFSLWDRLHAGALIPDLVMRQLIWGARYDKNWRSRLVKKKKVIGAVSAVKTNNVCSDETCMLFGTGFSHRHYTVHMKNYPVLDSFRAKNDVNHIHGNRFLLYADEFKEGREQLQRQGQLFNVYWPAFILGGSPKVGWSWPQQLLVMGMVRELTRTKPKPGEGITGEVVKGGMVAATSNGSRLVPCHLLSRTQEYVAFAGNGKRKGRGYQIIGRTDKGWLHRSGYVLPAREPSRESNQKRRDLMRLFLTDLSFLSEELGLVPAGVLNGQWKSIGQMMDCLRTGQGQDWLEACSLRIYAPADWRSRWRGYFSNKLGFAWIPETPEDYGAPAESEVAHSLSSANAIRLWLEKLGWSQRKLAEQITEVTGRHCSVRRVERNLSSRGPSGDFQKAVASIRGKLHVTDS